MKTTYDWRHLLRNKKNRYYRRHLDTKIQRSFTKHITGMNDMPYHERLRPDTGLKIFLQKCIIYRYYYIKRLVGTSL